MKTDRPGDWLWVEWDGEGFEPTKKSSTVYVTYDDVDIMDDLVRRALASALQRDGVADSLADGFKLLERAIVSEGHAGTLPGEWYYTLCDEDGETEYGDLVEDVVMSTWVEI